MSAPDKLADHIPRLRRYARALTGERFAADDLVQDTLERAVSRFMLFRRGSKLDAWLLSIMHNIFINQVRAQGNRATEASLDETAPELLADQASAFVSPSVRATQEDGLSVRDIDRALAMLPPEQREVLLLVSLEELSYEKTAQILGIPQGTVMSRLSRARERLRVLLAEPSTTTIPQINHLKVVK